MSENKQSILERYSQEIQDIMNQLTDLENNRYYENTGHRQDGSVSTNAQQLKKKIKELLIKIEKQSPSDLDQMAELFSNEKE
ncbi:hypothetical protein [Pseudobacillus badius]|uniref:hypothetical protein n=1 Tax=Bacillus badius TaxID=1455 RepID=UPI0007B389FE|nr:hypothetical protein [Bacillus badius]KZR56954.1 hypothetical protein A3781_04580 [Bacillus badius]